MSRISPRWQELRKKAARQLEINKALAMACFTRGLTYPAEWKEYDAALQAIVDATFGDADQGLPTQPELPVLTGEPVLGRQGEQGIQGIQGIQGEKGDKGDKGDTAPSVWGGGVP